jgi:predicted DCC family thiol-disulfide oxidoreductase YuxK
VPELTVLFDADCGICSHVARTLVRADTRHLLNLVALQVAALPDQPPRDELVETLHARDEDGRWFKGGAASVEIARRVPMLRPLGWYARLPLAIPVLDLVYRAFADNRHAISRLLGLKACRVPSGSRRQPSRL